MHSYRLRRYGRFDLPPGRRNTQTTERILQGTEPIPNFALCLVEGCMRYAGPSGYCMYHIRRKNKNGDPLTAATCTVDGCPEPISYSGYCKHHYARWLALTKEPCGVPGCTRLSVALGLCRVHYDRQRKNGSPTALLIHPRVPGQTVGQQHGYVRIHAPGHPNAALNGTIPAHVYVMSQVLGRPLHKGETVHHKNGVRDDNRPENLELWASHHPPGQRITDQIAWALELLHTYASDPSLWPDNATAQRWHKLGLK